MRIPTILGLAALLLVPTASGCDKKGKSAAGSGAMTPKCRPDQNSRIPKIEPRGDAEKQCAKDTDCVVTSMIIGRCCSHGCNQRWTYTRAFMKRLKEHWKTCCKGAKYDCPKYKCPQNPFKITARCKNRKCELVKTPIKR